MAGLMDFMGGMFGGGDVYGDLLNDEQKKAMQQQTMMTMAAKLLQAGGPSTTPTNLGQALGGAFLSGQEAYGKAGQNALQGMLTKQKIGEYKRQQDYLKALRAGAAPQPSAEGVMPQVQTPDASGIQLGATPQSSAPMVEMAKSTPAPAPLSKKDRMYADLMRDYEIARRYGMDDAAQKYFDQALKIKPTPKVTGQPFEVTDVNGNPVMVQQFDNGEVRTMSGFGPKRNVTLQNMGGQMVAVDMNAVQPNQAFNMSMSPDAAASNALAQAKFRYGQGQDVLSNARADQQLALQQQSAANAGGGTVEERKAAMFVGRLGGASKVFNSPAIGPDGKPIIGQDGKPVTIEDAFGKPGIMETMFASAPFGENLANQARSAGRQQYRQAQEDWVTAIMRPESGAVIGPDEMQSKIVTFFPQIGDSPEVIAQKKAAREESEKGLRLMAGRALGKENQGGEFDWVNGQLVQRTK